MEKRLRVKIGEEFKPSPQFKKLYYIYLMLGIILGVLTWYIPILIFAPPIVALIVSLPILAILIFAVYWIPKYYDTITSLPKTRLYGEEAYGSRTRE